ncbi:phage baseplate protein [Salinivibrio proteolyticus]|uniref:phage baseplate protein n=1 Tax=Salinivibrio proteolyticus TaxID=334715 RepID=UPI000988BC5A|nr:phage baseplate protein [Salinivibrio proteolyticus]OOF25050.1 phage baseplate protein [Salinivibrio proteolyticus]
MIAIDPNTGRTVTGAQALTCRFRRVLTTEVTSRIKRRGVGNRAISTLGKMQSPNTAMIVQNLTLEALAMPINGLTAFRATRCKATPSESGFHITVEGTWHGKPIKLEGGL